MERVTNISTEHQPKGSGRNPSDTLDRGTGKTLGVAKKDSATAKIDDEGHPLTNETPMTEQRPDEQPAEGGNETPPPNNGSPKPSDIATQAGATEAPPEPGDER